MISGGDVHENLILVEKHQEKCYVGDLKYDASCNQAICEEFEICVKANAK